MAPKAHQRLFWAFVGTCLIALVGAAPASAAFGFLESLGTFGSGDGQFVDAQGVGVDAGGNLYVADSGNSRVQVIDTSGAFVRKWGSNGTADGQFNRLMDVAVGPSGNVYTAEQMWGGQGRNLIQKFDSSGNFLTKWGTAQFDFNGVWGLAVDASENVYVADGGANQVKKFDSSGNLLTQWGSPGAGAGQFFDHKLSGIAVDAAGDVYTLEGNDPPPNPQRVQKFDSNGIPQNDFVDGSGNPTSMFTAIPGPGIDIDAAGNIYVVGGSTIARFTATGAPAGSVSDCQTVIRGVAAHPNGKIYAGASTGLFVFGEGGTPCTENAPARLFFEGDEGVTINAGAQYTNDPVVQLTIEPALNSTEIRLSNDGGFASPTTVPVAADRLYAWTLDSSGPERLPKTAYVRFANEVESSAQNFTDDIILDQTAPQVSSATLTGGGTTAAAASAASARTAVAAAAKRTFKLSVSAKDKVSGVDQLQVARKKSKPGKLQNYRERVKIKAKRPPRYVRVYDGAENPSKWRRIKPR